MKIQFVQPVIKPKKGNVNSMMRVSVMMNYANNNNNNNGSNNGNSGNGSNKKKDNIGN